MLVGSVVLTTIFAFIMAIGGDFTSRQVTITNSGDKKIDVNPLYFSIAETGRCKYHTELG
ncbi:hypothetical protein ACH4F3_26930 [Streptomyces anulatus]|uniref:hypothetical protein n=1 Tax=Streptomyces globisporus TaxID=1908 RepID=UPI0034610988